MRSFWLLTLVFFGYSIHYLDAQDVRHASGGIEIIQDPRIDSLESRYIYFNERNQTIEGYRIQIFFDAGNYSLQNAYKAVEAFLAKYPDVNAYVTFKEPYYRVRVGDFRTRLEAEGFRQNIMLEYPNAFIIKDNINPPKNIQGGI